MSTKTSPTLTAAQDSGMVLVFHFTHSKCFASNYRHDPKEMLLDQEQLSRLSIPGQIEKIYQHLVNEGVVHVRVRSLELYERMLTMARDQPFVRKDDPIKKIITVVGVMHPISGDKTQPSEMSSPHLCYVPVHWMAGFSGS